MHSAINRNTVDACAVAETLTASKWQYLSLSKTGRRKGEKGRGENGEGKMYPQ